MHVPPAPHILVTGFEPFGGEAENASGQVAQALDGQWMDGPAGGPVRVSGLVLPCVFGQALAVLDEALAAGPRLVLALGTAGGRAAFTPERVAINLEDARIPDNAQAQPLDRPVVPGGPAAYFSTLPVKAMVAALHEAGLPAQLSQTAGTYVCNHLFYGLMHRLHTLPALAGVRGGFMHLPVLPAQAVRANAAQPGLPLAAQLQAVQVALAAALAHAQDLALRGGTEA